MDASIEERIEDLPLESEESWFHALFGFREKEGDEAYEETKTLLRVDETKLTSLVNGRIFQIGNFSTPSLADLRRRCDIEGWYQALPGKLKVSLVAGSVDTLQALPGNRQATFQVASQFNCLEFAGPNLTPEMGVTAYVTDKTQGPACAVGAGPATVYRNYFVPVLAQLPTRPDWMPPPKQEVAREPQMGQTAKLQLNTLTGLSNAIGNVPEGRFFEMKGGYVLASDDGLRRLNDVLVKADKEILRAELCVGVHADVEVTSSNWGQNVVPPSPWGPHLITQVFGSAAAVSYSRNGKDLWEPFSRLILEASYEAALFAALENACRKGGAEGSCQVYLTLLGGGAFGNEINWIVDAIEHALVAIGDVGLDVYIVASKDGDVDPLLSRLVRS